MTALRIFTLLLPFALSAQRPVPVENQWTRVIIATSAPGPKGQMHKHEMNRVMVYLDQGAQQLAYEDGSKRDIPFGRGDVKWDPKAGLHTSQNTGGTSFRVVEVELKKSGGVVVWPENDPVRIAPGAYKLEFENDQVRVLRVKFAARQKIDVHEHTVPRIIVPLTEVHLQVTSVDGKQSSLKATPGNAIFGPAGRHHEENLLDAPIELILIDLKG